MTDTNYVKPPWRVRVIGARFARLFKPSIISVLSVPGRRTGTWHETTLAVLDHDGAQYLLSAYGHTEWSRNLRAAGTGRLTRRGRTQNIAIDEVPAAGLPPLIDAYLAQFGKMPTVAKTFEALPEPTDHPAFRITSTGAAP